MTQHKLSQEHELVVGKELRSLCRLGFLKTAKIIASMPDEELAALIATGNFRSVVDHLLIEHG